MAKEACMRGQVLVNDRPAKAGTDVHTGDIIKLSLGARRMTIKVLEVKDTVAAKEAANLYEIIEDYKANDDL